MKKQLVLGWLMLLASLFTPKISAESYVWDSTWPKTKDLRWGEVPGVSVDADDNVWVFHRGPEPLQLFSNDGEKLRLPFPASKVEKAHQVRIFGRDVWIVDQSKHVVRRLTGEPLQLGTDGHSGNDEAHFNQPTDIAVGKNGSLYVTDGYVNARVMQFDARGKFQRQWGKKGTKDGDFQLPHAIVSDSGGRLYVADRSNQRIQVFDAEGAFLSSWTNVIPWGLWMTPRDELWVCGSSPTDGRKLSLTERTFAAAGMRGLPPRDQIVVRMRADGTVEGTWKLPETRWVHGIAVDSRGNLFVSEIEGRRVRKYRREP